MMGTVRLAGRVISLSGSYGDDGLPISMPYKDLSEKVVQHIWDSLCRIPKSLQDEFWSGGGHNSAGKEAHSMKKWALENLKELSKPIKVIDN